MLLSLTSSYVHKYATVCPRWRTCWSQLMISLVTFCTPQLLKCSSVLLSAAPPPKWPIIVSSEALNSTQTRSFIYILGDFSPAHLTHNLKDLHTYSQTQSSMACYADEWWSYSQLCGWTKLVQSWMRDNCTGFVYTHSHEFDHRHQPSV